MTPNPAKPMVLLVDDDEHVRRDYARMLKHLGFDLETAPDGHEAALWIAKGPFAAGDGC